MTTVASTITERVQEALARDPKAMTIQIARQLGVPEVEVIRNLPRHMATELDPARLEQLIRALEPLEMVHVITSNASVTLEAFGQFGNFSTWGDYFNVQTKTLDMHIRMSQLAAAFAVRKPSHMDGVDTLSIQFYDRNGSSAFKVFLTFGSKAPSPERIAQFDSLVTEFARPS
jgi:putative heme utilization carrier protein HutX